jgi:ATP-dependent Clp protease protease subunit
MLVTKVNASPLIKTKELGIQAPVVVTVNDFDEESVVKFAEAMSKAENTGQKVIPIVIDSYGGYCDSVIAMMEIIKQASLPVATICIGKAMSCGAILLTCGDEGLRYCAPSSRIMIHEIRAGAIGKVTDIANSAEEFERLNKFILETMSLNCGHKPNYFEDIIHDKGHTDWFLTASEAVKHNIVQEIRVPRFEVNIDVSIELK